MKKKIGVFLGTVPQSGGAFQYSQAILEALNSLPENEFAATAVYISEPWKNYLQEYKVETIFVTNPVFWQRFERVWTLFCLPIGVLRWVYRRFHPVAKTLSKTQCDLWLFPAQDRWSYMMPVRALGTIHDLMHRYEARFPEVSAVGRGFRRDIHYAGICRYTKGILVDSEVGKQQAVDSYHIDESRVHVLPYIAPRYMRTARQPEGFSERYKLPSKYLFYPAQFWEHKNHKNLIKAVSLLRAALPDLKLVLVGSKKNAYEAISTMVKRLALDDHVRFLGYVPDEDMPELYRRARSLIMPTYFGPTNIPPLEAFAAGCPVAVSGIYGMPEQVGDAALLFDPDSVEQISEVIRRLWTDDSLCMTLKRRGKERSDAWGQNQFNRALLNIIQTVS